MGLAAGRQYTASQGCPCTHDQQITKKSRRSENGGCRHQCGQTQYDMERKSDLGLSCIKLDSMLGCRLQHFQHLLSAPFSRDVTSARAGRPDSTASGRPRTPDPTRLVKSLSAHYIMEPSIEATQGTQHQPGTKYMQLICQQCAYEVLNPCSPRTPLGKWYALQHALVWQNTAHVC